ncbi:MAG: hypothetical protein LBU89_00820 [Fibromonadaceae bacterium]|jgi:hypothetical protein|nr:hypothetical protein [Fibromonadaceae bacterium]
MPEPYHSLPQKVKNEMDEISKKYFQNNIEYHSAEKVNEKLYLIQIEYKRHLKPFKPPEIVEVHLN